MRNLKAATHAVSLCFLALVLAFFVPATSGAQSVEDEIRELRSRLERLEQQLQDQKQVTEEEKRKAEHYHSRAEKKAAGSMSAITDKVTFGGLIEVEASAENNDVDGDSSDVVLATVELSFDAEINDRVRGHVLLLHEEGESFILDEGIIEIDVADGLTVSLGQMYLPFGVFNSHFVSDPQTLELGETGDSVAALSYGNDIITATVAVFNGDAEEGGANDIEDYVLALDVNPIDGVSLHASYISDMAETDADITGLQGGPTIADSTAGFALSASVEYGKFAIEAEYVGAAEHFNIADLDADASGNGDRPEAFNLELAYTYTDLVEFAARYEGNSELFDFPDEQYGLAVSYGIFDNTTVALEFLHGNYDGGGNRDLLTGQVAIEF